MSGPSAQARRGQSLMVDCVAHDLNALGADTSAVMLLEVLTNLGFKLASDDLGVAAACYTDRLQRPVLELIQ